jgi:hypothetical protein
MAWKQPQLTDPPMGPTDEIKKAQHRLLFAFSKVKAADLGVVESGIFDLATDKALRVFQKNAGLPVDGVLTYDTKVKLGVVVLPPKAPTKKFVQQGVGFNTDAFLMGNPAHSYNMALAEEQAEFTRLAHPLVGVPKVLIGYSMGADACNKNLLNWPADRRREIEAVIQFGDPAKPPGPTLLGNDFGGSGISGVFAPEWVRDRYYSFDADGDMYPNATGLLPQLYSILTDLAMTTTFAMRLFSIFTNSVAGAGLLGLAGNALMPGFGSLSALLPMITPGGLAVNPAQSTSEINLFAMITNIPAIVQTLSAALKFISTNAHYHYHDQPQPYWRGLTAVDCAAQIIQETVPDGAIVYTIPGTVSWWNDGPPAWTAWKLP